MSRRGGRGTDTWDTTTWDVRADLIVVGSGVAGLTAALEATELGLRVVVVTKDAADAGSTRWAQGGVAVVVGDVPGDSVDAHIADTLLAGAGLCDAAAVASIIADGPAAVAALRRRGARFDRDEGERLARTREGGHTAFRVVHAGGDATGAEIERALVAAAAGARSGGGSRAGIPRAAAGIPQAAAGIPLLERHVVLDALLDERGAVAGVALLDDQGRAGVLRAPAVLLATGGYGQLYASTTNPDTATGDGIAMALRAGALVADLEFVQFHPTVLYDGPATGRRPLITEAVRGEGAVLVDRAGRRIMPGVHPLADLAPRDVVAAAITERMQRTGADCVYLDARAIEELPRRFPTVYAACRAAGIDPVTEPIPVTPAAHYACGGIVTDLGGRTAVTGLYAAGEVARTGLHGANRLASNSLLEGLVMGERVARCVAAEVAERGARPAGAVGPPERARWTAPRGLVQRAMSAAAGIGRDAAGLAAASDVVEQACVVAVPCDRAGVEDAALTVLATAVLAAAGTRTESRGSHLRLDFPERDDRWQAESIVLGMDTDGAPVVQAPAAATAGAA